jgi:hypothetical protein
MLTRMIRWFGLLLVTGLALAGCASTDPIYLRHQTTGRVVQCGPYPTNSPQQVSTALIRERGCMEDFQRQGYERVPSPTN